MAVLYVWHVVASVVIAAGMASGEGVTTMIDVGNGVSLPDRIAALTCAGLLNRPEALAAGVSIPCRRCWMCSCLRSQHIHASPL